MGFIFDRAIGPGLVHARPGRRALAAALACGLAAALAGCGERASSPAAPQAASAGGADSAAAGSGSAGAGAPGGAGSATPGAPRASDPMEVVADEALARRLQVGTVLTRGIADTIRVAGRFEVNQNRTARIGAPVTGRLTQIDAVLGQQVRQGQPLAQINSTELARAQLDYLRAHSQQQLTTRAVERAQLLLSADVIGTAELQRRQGEQSVAVSEKRAASDQLRQLGLSDDRIRRLEDSGQIQPTAAISATIGGTVIERRVAIGQVVNPADVLFVVADLGNVWASAEVPEQSAAFVKHGQRVLVEVPALDNERFTGKVAFVGDVVDPQTRTVRVGVEMENRALRFKPSMLITMLIEGPSRARQVVPAAAVVRDHDADHVFVEARPGVFRLVPMEFGPETDGVRALARPLPEGTRIVVDGAFHLNNVRAQQGLGAK